MDTIYESARPAALGGRIDDYSKVLRPNHIVEVSMPVRGMTIRQDIVVVDCQKDQLIAHTSNIRQFYANQSGQPIFIRTPDSDTILMARLADLGLAHGRLTLTGLHQMDHDWTNRFNERVQPASPVFLKVTLGKVSYRGCLKDISRIGLSITLSGPRGKLPEKAAGQRITLALKLPPILQPLSLRGEVMHVQTLSPCLARIGIHILPSARTNRLLETYIQARKHEILDEVQDALICLWKLQETKDQYF